MLKDFISGLLGDRHAREAKRMQPTVDRINEIYEELQSLSEEELKAQTDKFRGIIAERTGEVRGQLEELRERKRVTEDAEARQAMALEMRTLEDALDERLGEVLEDLLPEAFATVKEACRRNMGREIEFTGTKTTWDMIPYDVQLVGAIALHQGKVAEMATGEGKTLVATMPLYLNALTGRGAHLVTVNTYLAQRDAEWMGTIYNYLGLSVDCVDLHDPGTPERRQAYHADITYGTNNEFGFDYLRDNMVHALEQRVQRPHYYAIIDEVDSILIDEARTPLIISGPVAEEQSDVYRKYNPQVADLFRKQLRVSNELVAEAEKELAEAESLGDDKRAVQAKRFDAGEKLLAVKRGTPRHKKLLKMFADEPSIERLVQDVEAAYMREKRLQELDELLFFQMDEKGHTVMLSDQGLDVLSPNDHEAFVAPDLSVDIGRIQEDESLSADEKREKIEALEADFAEKSQKIHAIHQLLKAHALYNKDEQYIVEDGQVVIVDEFTGRKMAGRRWSDGLHQAVEAKEGVNVRGETQTYATITIQNYFRMYDKLAGMTGTAETEEGEFHQIYDLDVMVIPTNRPIVRDDRQDLIFRTKREKFNAIMDEIQRLHMLKLPVLVGTVSVDVSETLSRMLKRRGIPHRVLNAKYHEQESKIVAEAGQPGSVTIATNMAGRGTDIKLGPGVKEERTVGWAKQNGVDLDALPHPADPSLYVEDAAALPDDHVLEYGGLHIVGSERHESRRIDRQLRGRAGRQGDPGASQFLMSLEDDLMRLFKSERIASVMERMGAEEGEVITHALVTKSIERAQKRVETQNFEARKRLLDYDDVMNQQREVIYDLRLFALEGGEDLVGEVREMLETGLREVVAEFVDEEERPEQWDLAGLRQTLVLDYMLVVNELPNEPDPDHPFDTIEQVEQAVIERAREGFRRKLDQFGDHRDRVLSWVVLSVIDEKWRDHLYDLDHLKASIGFRGWGQKDPLIEYKREAYDMFVDLMSDLRRSIASIVFRAQLAVERRQQPQAPKTLTLSGPSETPETAVRPAGQPAPERRETDRFVPGTGGGTGTGTGTGAPGRAAAPVAGAAMSGMRGQGLGTRSTPDPTQLATNRGGEGERKQQPVVTEEKVGRNDPCPCGSGKKYKKCHGVGVA